MRDNPAERRRRIQAEEIDRIELGRAVADGLRIENSGHTKREMSVSQIGDGYKAIRDRAIKAIALARIKQRNLDEIEYGIPFTPEKRQEILLAYFGRN